MILNIFRVCLKGEKNLKYLIKPILRPIILNVFGRKNEWCLGLYNFLFMITDFSARNGGLSVTQLSYFDRLSFLTSLTVHYIIDNNLSTYLNNGFNQTYDKSITQLLHSTE